MEYGCLIETMNKEPKNFERVMDEDFFRYVGWQVSQQEFDKKWFAKTTLNEISTVLKEKLKCLRTDGRPIVVADRVIAHMMSEVFHKNRPILGDGYFMFNIVPEKQRDDYNDMKVQVIEMIFNTIKTEYEMDQNNRKLSIWSTLYGDFNKQGLRQYSTIKINEMNINKVRFNMNY